MIVGPNAEAIDEIVLLEVHRRPNGSIRPVFTEIDRVLMLCNACEHGVCEIDYWIRDEENLADCRPQVPGCKKCPQWTCASCCHGNDRPPEVVGQLLGQ